MTVETGLARLTTSLDVSPRQYQHLCLYPCFDPLLMITSPSRFFLIRREVARPRTPRRPRHVETGALLDTGSLAGDFISQHEVSQLQGDSRSYSARHPNTVCSGLDSTCYSSLLLLDIGMKFLTCDNLKQTINPSNPNEVRSLFPDASRAGNSESFTPPCPTAGPYPRTTSTDSFRYNATGCTLPSFWLDPELLFSSH
jgi:hypothetical protein